MVAKSYDGLEHMQQFLLVEKLTLLNEIFGRFVIRKKVFLVDGIQI